MEKLPITNDTVQYFGGELKSLGDGKIGGLLIRFGSQKDTDLEGDFFNANTDFDVDWKNDSVKASVYYDHGQDPTLGQKKLGGGQKAVLTLTEEGIWAEAQLDLRDRYEAKVYELISMKKLGWSSGTSPHMVEREIAGNKSQHIYHIKKWNPCIDATITPIPAEYRNEVIAIKSLKRTSLKSLMGNEEEIEETIFGDNLEERLTYNLVSSLCDIFLWNGMWSIIYNDLISNDEKITKLDSGVDELASKIKLFARALLTLDPDGLATEYAAAKSLSFATPEIKRGAKLSEHVKYVLDEVKNLGKRITTIQQVSGGLKKGAEFNATNKATLNDLADKLAGHSKDIMDQSDMIKEMVGTDEQDDSQKSTEIASIELRLAEARINHLNNQHQCQ